MEACIMSANSIQTYETLSYANFIGLEDFPPVSFNAFEHHLESDIACYLTRFFRESAPAEPMREQPVAFAIPSVLDLSMYFHCHEFDILDGLEVLKRDGYHCEMRDFYKPIVVHHRPTPVIHVKNFMERRRDGFRDLFKQIGKWLNMNRKGLAGS
jgi:hypothetical protein